MAQPAPVRDEQPQRPIRPRRAVGWVGRNLPEIILSDDFVVGRP
jgi:hypothetical protein